METQSRTSNSNLGTKGDEHISIPPSSYLDAGSQLFTFVMIQTKRLRFVGFFLASGQDRGERTAVWRKEFEGRAATAPSECGRPLSFAFSVFSMKMFGSGVNMIYQLFCTLYQTVPRPPRRAGFDDLSLSLPPVR